MATWKKCIPLLHRSRLFIAFIRFSCSFWNCLFLFLFSLLVNLAVKVVCLMPRTGLTLLGLLLEGEFMSIAILYHCCSLPLLFFTIVVLYHCCSLPLLFFTIVVLYHCMLHAVVVIHSLACSEICILLSIFDSVCDECQ